MQKVYARPKALKKAVFHYCPGCGHSIIHRLIAELVDEMDIQDNVIGIPPPGCSVFAYNYLDVDMLESAHGRGAAVATGIKRANPDVLVFTYQGDGDLAAIGTAETIHAANRGEKITAIFINNAVYGMTGGQMAPTTLLNMKTTTSPFGRDEKLEGAPIKISEMLALVRARCILNAPPLTPRQTLERRRKRFGKPFRLKLTTLVILWWRFLPPVPPTGKWVRLSPGNGLTKLWLKNFPWE